ncbi:MAG: hypothetical protein HC849_25965 [Oscillatoriales cyanobacterium RU_3_3]|nr:hypothetical protein [Oscillatoriales cyanobacterium RU_3_3]NJR22863.1 hypothetical protein [Richelia sp. CSU_2_1]
MFVVKTLVLLFEDFSHHYKLNFSRSIDRIGNSQLSTIHYPLKTQNILAPIRYSRSTLNSQLISTYQGLPIILKADQ